ncbi:MAG: NUDIX hydrolase [Myxococcales bacterium]|nr:NUDIX hydrolase [Myxococcales bacterium]
MLVELVEDLSPPQPPGFLQLRRRVLQNRYADRSLSAPYSYDSVDRAALDAVVLVLFTPSRRVLLRTSLRPPLCFRPERLQVPEGAPGGGPVLWELPAGLIEPEEHGPEGLRAACARETLEETGYALEPMAFEPLGAPVYLSPGVIAERLHYFAVEVDEGARGVPTEDGTPVEAGAAVRFFALDEALSACERGDIGDVKSEVGLRRLQARWERRG